MDEQEQRSRAQAAQDPSATQFVTVDWVPDETPAPHRRSFLPAILLGVLLGLALLAGWAYAHRGHAPPAYASTRTS